jgi:hypothetical protein
MRTFEPIDADGNSVELDASGRNFVCNASIDENNGEARVKIGGFIEKHLITHIRIDGEYYVPLARPLLVTPIDVLNVTVPMPLPRQFNSRVVTIDYTNWRGERRMRKICPESIAFDSTEWHSTQQWLLHAIDMEDMKSKTFAIKDIHEWKS